MFMYCYCSWHVLVLIRCLVVVISWRIGKICAYVTCISLSLSLIRRNMWFYVCRYVYACTHVRVRTCWIYLIWMIPEQKGCAWTKLPLALRYQLFGTRSRRRSEGSSDRTFPPRLKPRSGSLYAYHSLLYAIISSYVILHYILLYKGNAPKRVGTLRYLFPPNASVQWQPRAASNRDKQLFRTEPNRWNFEKSGTDTNRTESVPSCNYDRACRSCCSRTRRAASPRAAGSGARGLTTYIYIYIYVYIYIYRERDI